MNNTIKLLDVVALSENLSERGLSRGQVGTVVEKLDEQMVEDFTDNPREVPSLTMSELTITGRKRALPQDDEVAENARPHIRFRSYSPPAPDAWRWGR